MNLKEILNTSWKLRTVLSAFVIILVLISIGTVYVYSPKLLSVRFPSMDEKAQAAVNLMLERNINIAGIQIVEVDLQKNTRFIRYTSIRDPEISKQYNSFILNQITREVPVFTGKENQDSRLISIINHEYICYPFTDTITYEFMPDLSKHIKTVCSTTIPAFRGKFSGFVAVFLKKEPTDHEKDVIRIESTKLSIEIYNYIK